MDVSNEIIRIFSGHQLSYFDLSQVTPCLDMVATPLAGDGQVEMAIVDFGPMMLIKRRNIEAAVEQYQFPAHIIAIQLPSSERENIASFQNVLGGISHSPFLSAGASVRWIIPANTWMYQLHIDSRWLTTVLGQDAMKDYLELTCAASRKAYDWQALMKVGIECEQALNTGFQRKAQGERISELELEKIAHDILMPCIFSDVGENKCTTRQKILGKALDFIHHNSIESISLKELAQAASTSVRNVQIVFKQELGVTPIAYIQQFRLHRFRHRLSYANSVTEAAYASGFKHLGRLTERYASVFNNTPSVHLTKGSQARLNVGDLFEMNLGEC
jgi:AraC-like DNA-binding protein